MKQLLRYALWGVMLSVFMLQAAAEPVILRLHSGVSAREVRVFLPGARSLCSEGSADSQPTRLRNTGASDVCRYIVTDGADYSQAWLEAIPGVSSVDFAPIVLAQHRMVPSGDQGSIPGTSADFSRFPLDPSFADQWYLRNTGQTILGNAGTRGSDARVSAAWQRIALEPTSETPPSTGPQPEYVDGEFPIVAVIDAGVSASHPELRRLLLPGLNLAGGDRSNTDDGLNSHGTAVAGMIAAEWNNQLGIAGIAPGVRILPVRIFNQLGFGSEAWAAEGLRFAVDQGADVVVMSFGFSGGTSAFRDAVRYAHDAGVIMVASTGNLASDPVPYPARWPEVIAVGATDQADEVTVFSGGGPEIDLVAPGINILTTADRPGAVDGYRYETGTSFAAPIVAGVAALVELVHPELPASTTRDVLLSTAFDLGEPGYDERTGWGRIDAAAVIDRVLAIKACVGDVNQDGSLDGSDFTAWLNAFSSNNAAADQNGDGVVNSADFGAWLQNFGRGCDL